MSIEIDGKRYSWNTPCCLACWEFMHSADGRVPYTTGEFEDEAQCGNCGAMTKSGILVRRDPRLIRYPALEDDE